MEITKRNYRRGSLLLERVYFRLLRRYDYNDILFKDGRQFRDKFANESTVIFIFETKKLRIKFFFRFSFRSRTFPYAAETCWIFTGQ